MGGGGGGATSASICCNHTSCALGSRSRPPRASASEEAEAEERRPPQLGAPKLRRASLRTSAGNASAPAGGAARLLERLGRPPGPVLASTGDDSAELHPLSGVATELALRPLCSGEYWPGAPSTSLHSRKTASGTAQAPRV